MTRATVTQTTGGSKSAEARSQTEQLLRHAAVIVSASGQSLPGGKILKIVHRYQHQVERNGWVFWEYVANALLLTAEQRAHMVVDPEVSRVISYLDNTGEDAVRHVMRERGY